MRNPLKIAAIGAAGLALNVWLTWNLLVPGAGWDVIAGATAGRNDFLSFYAGAVLGGTSDLYDPAKVSEVQVRATGRTGESQKFIRLPCYALFLRPLGWLPYGSAYLLWEILSAAGLVAAVVLWPGPSPATKWLIACWTLPVFAALFNGQDDTLVLFWVALAAWLLHRRWPLAAGIALAFAASKYHLIALVPMVILAQKRWRVMAGAIGGGCMLLALSFVGTGWDWPRRYLRMLQEPGLAPDVSHAPSFYANFQAMRFGTAVEIAAVILLAAIVFRISRMDLSFEWPLALALAGSILVSLHSWMADCTLLLPALMLASEAAVPYIRFSALVLATPMPWLLLQLPAPLPTFTRILMLGLVLTGLTRFGVKARPPLVKLGKSHYTPS